jgi:hypothetical protein
MSRKETWAKNEIVQRATPPARRPVPIIISDVIFKSFLP